MENITQQLEQIIEDFDKRLKQLNDKDFAKKPEAGKWSKKEELGHLIDSAHNNLRRFIVAQYEDQPKIVYDQNFWNKAVNYQQQSTAELISLWILLNKQIVHAFKIMSSDAMQKTCDTGKGAKELHTIKWLADDYLKHLLHHLHHLLDLKPMPY